MLSLLSHCSFAAPEDEDPMPDVSLAVLTVPALFVQFTGSAKAVVSLSSVKHSKPIEFVAWRFSVDIR